MDYRTQSVGLWTVIHFDKVKLDESLPAYHFPMESWIHVSMGFFSLLWKSLFARDIIQLGKVEFGGASPLTMRHGLRQSNEIISRPVASFRSAYGIRQT